MRFETFALTHFNIPLLTVNQVGHTAYSSLVASDYASYLNQCATKLSKLLFEYCITFASGGVREDLVTNISYQHRVVYNQGHALYPRGALCCSNVGCVERAN